MQDFEYLCPKSIEECCAFLQKYGKEAALIAGGTDILVQLREKSKRFKEMKCLIDISCLDELHSIVEKNTAIEIGALVTYTEISKSKLLWDYVPLLCQACQSVGSPQIRNMGTIGGSVCNGSVAADPLTPLIALEAQAAIVSSRGKRHEKVKTLFVRPGELSLERDEMIIGFTFKKPAANSFCYFEKLGRRKALAISRMNVSAVISLDGNGNIEKASVCPGCVFAVPDLVEKAEKVLVGNKPSEKLFLDAGKAVAEDMIERTGIRWSTKYKEPVIEWLTQRALMKSVNMEVQ